MSFGLLTPESERKLTYGGYLQVGELLSLQKLESAPPQHDETLFIIIHQVYELWFKQLLHELDTIVPKLREGQALAVHRMLRRCIEIQRVLIAQLSILETMTPMDFLAFRDRLMPASGFQSWQFREVEFVSGLKDERFLKFFAPGSQAHAALAKRLGEPTLGDAFDALLRHRGFPLPPSAGAALDEARLSALVQIYSEAERHYDLYLLAESLIEYDELFMLWRLRHVKMVERMIGAKTGTGGSTGAAYLRTTTEKPFFPALWEVRSRLGDGSGYGGPAPAQPSPAQ